VRILLVHQYFKTPEQGGGIRSFHIAKKLQDIGHEVTILTGSPKQSQEELPGIKIHYFDIAYDNKFGFWRRIFAFWRFVIVCKRHVTTKKQYDLAYVISTPLTTAYAALYFKKKYGLSFAFEVGDLWPDVPIELGMIRNKLVISYLRNLEKRAYSEAKYLIALSPAIKKQIDKKLENSRTVLIATNFSDCNFFKSNYLNEVVFSKTSPLQVSYIGTLGYANHLEYLIELATACSHEELPIHFNILGDGSVRNRLIGRSENFENITWHEAGGMISVKMLMNRTQVAYVSLRKETILESGSPNKLFDALAAGKMIVLNFNGWMKDLVEEHHCGFTYNPEKPEEFVKEISKFISNPLLLEKYQKNARELGQSQFSVEMVTGRIADFIQR
jgi:glycosyltransferase involved in cell wall biosynthesis